MAPTSESLNERNWCESLVPRLSRSLGPCSSADVQLGVKNNVKLPYTSEIHEYAGSVPSQPVTSGYQTDLLVFDILKDGRWIPRVVIECKLGRVSTHDALTYSSKAATHKHVHPYLRYGFLAGEREHFAIPVRLVRHGAYFDFMVTWEAARPTNAEWRAFITLLVDEVKASRTMQELLQTNRLPGRKKYHILHRPLIFK